MKNILVFCAGNRKARANYGASILKPISRDMVLSSFPREQEAALLQVEKDVGGFYAWGLGTTRRAAFFWNRLEVGDLVLGFYEFQYRVVARIACKSESGRFAQNLWGSEDWSRVLFFTKPQPVNVPARDVCPPLCSTYRGTTRISDNRVADIISEYGDLATFIERRFGASLRHGLDEVSPHGRTAPVTLNEGAKPR